ncbi:ComF family protein [Sulfurimonas sp. C5]|uniref:ComF family protein n=1 Tax=Sulfurimonas sp. C5 TaxID=3036947 RepID=UPI002456B864|nr:ComF family protein [Sulfurimonas sp. C5]MDH4945105.1 ComF family protein [Sulfurimonas sp. C5]
MRCMMCERFSFSHICSSCQNNFLQPSLYKRTLPNNIQLISFYKYDEIKKLLHTKHSDLGYHIYNILAKLSFAKFADEFHTDEKFFSIAVDDHVRHGYSHTAILNKHLKSYNITPLYNQLRAQNHLTYSGKSKYFRRTNPRSFKSNTGVKENIILVDDIVTTGTTLNEAIETFGKERVSFCLSLVDLN